VRSRRLRHAIVHEISDHADDGDIAHRSAEIGERSGLHSRRRAGSDLGSDRIPAGEIVAREFLVHNRDGQGCGSVAFGKIAPLD
jgi:hypothetical protein